MLRAFPAALQKVFVCTDPKSPCEIGDVLWCRIGSERGHCHCLAAVLRHGAAGNELIYGRENRCVYDASLIRPAERGLFYRQECVFSIKYYVSAFLFFHGVPASGLNADRAGRAVALGQHRGPH